jgi:hypothetical protein
MGVLFWMTRRPYKIINRQRIVRERKSCRNTDLVSILNWSHTCVYVQSRLQLLCGHSARWTRSNRYERRNRFQITSVAGPALYCFVRVCLTEKILCISVTHIRKHGRDANNILYRRKVADFAAAVDYNIVCGVGETRVKI